MTARDASVDWVRRSLAHELREDSPTVGTRAENLVAIAERHHVPVEFLVRWIHAPAPHKAWAGRGVEALVRDVRAGAGGTRNEAFGGWEITCSGRLAIACYALLDPASWSETVVIAGDYLCRECVTPGPRDEGPLDRLMADFKSQLQLKRLRAVDLQPELP